MKTTWNRCYKETPQFRCGGPGWWYLPLALTGLLLFRKVTSLLPRPLEGEKVEKAVDEAATESAHKREMEKLGKLIELERLKQARQPEPVQPESRNP